jgi:hypothetical protein
MPSGETLYNTPTPKKPMAEYYELLIRSAPEGGADKFSFTVRHGWWDEVSREAKNSTQVINPEEGFSYAEAREMYEEQRAYLAKRGFVHSFSPDYLGEKEYEYNLIDVKE